MNTQPERKRYRRRIQLVDKEYQLRYLMYHDGLELLALVVGVFLLFFLFFLFPLTF